jgi:hypothetical protein
LPKIVGAGAIGVPAVAGPRGAPPVPGAFAKAGVSCGGRTLTGACLAACWTICCGICRAAGATGAAFVKTRAGTIVAAPRFAKFWLATCGGGSAAPRLPAALVI